MGDLPATNGRHDSRGHPSANGHETRGRRSSANGTGAAVTTVIADDDPLVRRLLADKLRNAGFVIAGVAGSGREAVELIMDRRPDVILLDLVMPDGDGLDVIQRVRAAGCLAPAVLLTSTEDDDIAIAALRAGAAGCLCKNIELESLPRTLRAVLEGEPAISRRLGTRLVERLRVTSAAGGGIRPVRSPLTPREWEVLDLLCAGRSTDGIAQELVLSIETVRSHIKSILAKLRVSSRAEAVALAYLLRRAPAD